jgi:hypothetical protein
MSKKVITLFTFGVFLILIGALGKVLQWPQASVLLATGLTFESAAIILFAWNKLKKNG